jgi:phytanoyl-CoA hydroxylase
MATMVSLQADYERHGFAVMERIIDPALLDSIRSAALRIVEDFDIDRQRAVFTTRDRDAGRDQYFVSSGEAIHCFLEEDALGTDGQLRWPKARAINKIGHALHDLNPQFEAFCRQPVLADLLRGLGYRSPQLWQSMYIFKQPHIGGEVRWHQDATYLMTSPATVIGLWVAVEDADRENGCLWVQPGGHVGPLREIYQFDHVSQRAELRTIDVTPWPGDRQAVPVEVPAGSLVMFHDHMPHFSSHNHSPRSRHAFTMHFAESTSRWSELNWLQRPTLGPFLL